MSCVADTLSLSLVFILLFEWNALARQACLMYCFCAVPSAFCRAALSWYIMPHLLFCQESSVGRDGDLLYRFHVVVAHCLCHQACVLYCVCAVRSGFCGASLSWQKIQLVSFFANGSRLGCGPLCQALLLLQRNALAHAA